MRFKLIGVVFWGLFLFVGSCATSTEGEGLAGVSSDSAQVRYEPNWESLDSRGVAPWFQDAKLGVYVHLGPSTVPSWSPKGTYSEWYQKWLQDKGLFGNGDFTGREVYDYHAETYGKDFSYFNFGEMFHARSLDADKVAKLLEDSGVRYALIASKHHDGFCMWPSEEANEVWGRKWNSVDIGPKRDLMREMEVAIKKTSVKFGAYYSLYEWYNPLWLEDRERYAIEYMHPQFKDLVERYEPDLIWGDGEWDLESEKWRTPELLAWLFNESAVRDTVVINDRWGQVRYKHGGYYTTEYEAGLRDEPHPWEEARGLGFSFGFNKAEDSWDYSSPRTLLYLFLNTVSNGGNLLLSIGIDPDGNIPAIMQDRLLGLGEWLGVNGEAIYGTRRWETPCQWSEDGEKYWMPKKEAYLPSDYIIKQTVEQQPGYAVREIFFTQKENCVYAIVPKFPKGELVIRDFVVSGDAEVTFLGTDLKLSYRQEGDDLVVEVPYLTVDELPCQYAWTIKIENL